MIKAFVALIALLVAGSAGFAADSETAALDMVRKLNLGENMKVLGMQAALRSQTYKAMSEKVGAENARALVTQELNRAAPKYQGEWDKNLASAYAPLFSTEELKSLTDMRRESPYIKKFMDTRKQVSDAMQAKSMDLLKSYVAEAMTSAFRKVVPGK